MTTPFLSVPIFYYPGAVSGQLFSYVANSTTPQVTYSDAAGSVPNTNPVVLDTTGAAIVRLGAGLAYDFVLKDQTGTVTLWTANNYVQPLSSLTQATVAAVLNPQTPAELAAGVTPVNLQYETVPLPVLLRYGGDPTGVADSRTAFNTASTVNVPFVVPSGTYLINSNVTIAPNVLFEPGAILRPAAGVTVTLSSSFQAGVYQVFDLSLGGLVALPRSCGEVWAEWWGARGDLIKTNNEVGFNQAWYALIQVAGGTQGGTINIDRGDFYTSGKIYNSDNVSMVGRGNFYTLIKANAATWGTVGSGTYMHQSQSAVPINFTGALAATAVSATLTAPWGLATTTYSVVFFETLGGATEERTVTLTNGAITAIWAGGLTNACTVNAVALTYIAMFNNRLEKMRFDANNLPAITAVMYAPAWQQKCGPRNLYVANFQNFGLFIDNGYGGAAQLTFHQTEFVASADSPPGGACIRISLPGYTVGYLTVTYNECDVQTATPSITFTAAPVATAVSATLNTNWAHPSGVWNVWFVETAGGNIESRLVTLTNGATTATWSVGLANNCNAAATAITPNVTGWNITGRVINNCVDVHGEQVQNMFQLGTGAKVVGTAIKVDGGPSVQNIFNCLASWTGTINVTGCEQAGATAITVDANRAYAIANYQPVDDNYVWPPNAMKAYCGGVVTGAGVPVLAYNSNVTSVAHNGAGSQRITLSLNMDGISNYDVIATSMDSAAPQCSVNKQTATTFDVVTASPTGVATDVSAFNFKVYHRP